MSRRALVIIVALAVSATALATLGLYLASNHPVLLVAGLASALYPALETASHGSGRFGRRRPGYAPFGDPWRGPGSW